MEMKKLSGAVITLMVIGAIALVLVIAYVSSANSANRQEANIEASFQQSQNVLGQLAPKLRDTLGVTNLQVEAVKNVIVAANGSRYGAGGAKAVTQFVAEQNPNLDQSTFRQAVDMIEAARNDFAAAQEQTIDRNRAYKTSLRSIPGGFFKRIAGYPSQEYLDRKYDNIVVSSHAADAFNTRRDDGVDVNNMN